MPRASRFSSQLVDLDIADVGGAFSISADDASWIAFVATMAELRALGQGLYFFDIVRAALTYERPGVRSR